MPALIPSQIRAIAHRRMALPALHANPSLATRVKRYNQHILIVLPLKPRAVRNEPPPHEPHASLFALEQVFVDARKPSEKATLDAALKAIIHCRPQLELSSTNSALELLLELLDAAHDKALSGDQLHCLLLRLQEKLRNR